MLNDDFERLETGTGARLFLEQGNEAQQASTVQIINKPGANICQSSHVEGKPLLSW